MLSFSVFCQIVQAQIEQGDCLSRAACVFPSLPFLLGVTRTQLGGYHLR